MTVPLVVVDASVALAWILPDSPVGLRYAQAVRTAQSARHIFSVVPDFWPAETAYRLLKAARTKPSPLRGSLKDAIDLLDNFPQAIEPSSQSVAEIVAWASQYNLQGWDALYFDLAIRRKAMMATLDGGLKTACRRFNIPLWQPEPE